jgi:hypothetical protein
MTKYLRYEAALDSPVYQQIAEEAYRRLLAVGSFEKDEVLKETRHLIFKDAIHWEFIKRMLESRDAAHDVELIPVAASYFKRHADEQEVTFPERFVATGHGKKTAGYVLATAENGHFVTYNLKTKKNRAVGIAKKANRLRQVGDRRGIADCTSRDDLCVGGLDQQITPPSRQITDGSV